VKTIVLLTACSLGFSAMAQQGWQQELHYSIDVALNDTSNGLDGFIKIMYVNHSPDTLDFIWFHLWPNAFKTDRTAFSEQMLENGRTDFYFSDKDQRGYINRLDFRVDGDIAKIEDHPEFIDAIKVLLSKPLLPGKEILITTPFHEKLPLDFSRSGHLEQSYQVTQWYPKPAVYDREGWHPMAYLDQGESYSEFGSYDVRITVPKKYVVAATGELQNEEEKKWLDDKSNWKWSPGKVLGAKPPSLKRRPPSIQNRHSETANISQDVQVKTLHYWQRNIQDFAWFADKQYLVNHDTTKLASGRVIDLYCFYTPGSATSWSKGVQMMKEAIQFHSRLLGEYPYGVVSVAEAKIGSGVAAGYPMIASICPLSNELDLEIAIEHEIGHNWFGAAIGSDPREFPWMSEGINTYYDRRFIASKYGIQGPFIQQAVLLNDGRWSKPGWLKNKWPEDPDRLLLDVITKEKTDQSISTSSEGFSKTNYALIAQTKASFWMMQLEDSLGKLMLDSCMRVYFHDWEFRHPYPRDLQIEILDSAKKTNDRLFGLLDKKGPLPATVQPKFIRPTFLFSFVDRTQFNYVGLSPGFGYNLYDRFMVGALIHNYNLPAAPFQFLLAPLYATASKQLNGLANLSYTWHPEGHFKRIKVNLAFARFSTMSGVDSSGKTIFGGFFKLVPALRLDLRPQSPRSTIDQWVDWKTYIIAEKSFGYVQKTTDSLYYPTTQDYGFRYLNQFGYNIVNYRALYPYHIGFQIQQGSDFYRLNFTTNYFFNYALSGGMSLRFFAAKFGYIGGQSAQKQFETTYYQPKLTASIGSDDYTYDNYFIGRTQTTGFASQQMMMKDGGLKIRTDLFQGLQGRSDNWIAAVNFNSTLPQQLIPRFIPLKVFLDVGTYADAWSSNPPTSKFLYVAGLELSFLKGLLNFYAPILYSSDFSSNLKTVPQDNTFWKKISFSMDIQFFNPKTSFPNIPQP
jgi:hypothetical protein